MHDKQTRHARRAAHPSTLAHYGTETFMPSMRGDVAVIAGVANQKGVQSFDRPRARPFLPTDSKPMQRRLVRPPNYAEALGVHSVDLRASAGVSKFVGKFFRYAHANEINRSGVDMAPQSNTHIHLRVSETCRFRRKVSTAGISPKAKCCRPPSAENLSRKQFGWLRRGATNECVHTHNYDPRTLSASTTLSSSSWRNRIILSRDVCAQLCSHTCVCLMFEQIRRHIFVGPTRHFIRPISAPCAV